MCTTTQPGDDVTAIAGGHRLSAPAHRGPACLRDVHRRTARAVPQHDYSRAEGNDYRPLRYDAAGLRGERLRVLVAIPTDDALIPQDLPPGTTDAHRVRR